MVDWFSVYRLESKPGAKWAIQFPVTLWHRCPAQDAPQECTTVRRSCRPLLHAKLPRGSAPGGGEQQQHAKVRPLRPLRRNASTLARQLLAYFCRECQVHSSQNAPFEASPCMGCVGMVSRFLLTTQKGRRIKGFPKHVHNFSHVKTLSRQHVQLNSARQESAHEVERRFVELRILNYMCSSK